MPLTIPSRTPWEDRFRTPTASALRGAIASQFVPPFDHARSRLSQISGAIEAIRWHGVWKWTFEYTCTAAHAEPFAYLVPDPAKPRLCVSVPESVTSVLDVRRLSKTVRETLGNAPAVDGIRWATWDVATKSGMDEVVAFIAAYRTATAPCPEASSADVPTIPNSVPASAPSVMDAPSKPKPRSRAKSPNSAAKQNGTASPTTGPKAGSDGTRRARGRQ